jgi:hypothetical protein
MALPGTVNLANSQGGSFDPHASLAMRQAGIARHAGHMTRPATR